MANHKKGTRVTKSEKQEVFVLLERGKAPLAIARDTGISPSKVYQIKREYRKILRQPHTPLQMVAYEMCQQRNHEFLEARLDIDGEGDKLRSEACEIEIIYGRVSIKKDVLEQYYRLTLTERTKNPIQPRIVSLGDSKLFEGGQERDGDQLFPMVVQILTCWFCGETRKRWSWLDATDQAVGSSTGFSPSTEDLSKFGQS